MVAKQSWLSNKVGPNLVLLEWFRALFRLFVMQDKSLAKIFKIIITLTNLSICCMSMYEYMLG